MLAGYGYDGLFWAELFYSGRWKLLQQELSAQFKHHPRLLPRRLARMLLPHGFSLFAEPSGVPAFLSPELVTAGQAKLQIENIDKYHWNLFLKNKSYHLMSSSSGC